MPTIEILTVETVERDTGITRHAEIEITEAGTTYAWRVGGLPTEGDLQTVLDARADTLWRQASARAESPDPVQSNARRLRDYARLAANNTAEIRGLYIATIDLDIASEDGTGPRFTSVAGIVNGWGAGLRTRFHAGFNAEYGVDAEAIGLQNLTGAQRAQYLQYARSWAAMYSTLVVWASMS